MPLRLEGAAGLLTGATGGIGRALAERLATAGAHLVLSARDAAALERLADALPGRHAVVPADLARPGEAQRLARAAEDTLGRVDLLVNAAGVGYWALGLEAEPARLRHLFEVNTFAPWELARAVAPGMVRRGGGTILNVLSCSGRVPLPSAAAYGGSTSAHATLAATLRLELAPSGVRVVNVFPGTVDTAFADHALREGGRPGLCLGGGCGRPVDEVAERILAALGGRRGEVWLDRRGRWLAAAAVLWPALVDRILRRLRDWALARPTDHVPHEERRWRLWQVETSIACNLQCVMCPWVHERCRSADGLMRPEVWAALRPHLDQVVEVDLSGGGEPLLNPRLAGWLAEAKAARCRTGFLTNGTLLTPERVLELTGAGVDWVAVSIDGATPEVYRAHRPGASFAAVCDGVRRLAAARVDGRPRLLLNFVVTPANVHQLEAIVELAAELGMDAVQLKQADVVRGEHGAGFALFAGTESRRTARLQRDLRAALRHARRLGLAASAAAVVPEEQPVCEQDPRSSLFIRHDGVVAPCINLARGGLTRFLGEPVEMPSVHYGRLPQDDLQALWSLPPCSDYRAAFAERERIYGSELARQEIAPSMQSLREALEEARRQMPPAPDGCRVCHYLYGL